MGPLGCPRPVRPQRSPNARSFRSFSRRHARGRDSSDNPLLGFDSPSWCNPSPWPSVSRPGRLSWGLVPFGVSGGEGPRPTRQVGSPAPFQRWVPPAGPTPLATVPLTGSSSPSATLIPSPPARHFQTGCARGVFPTGVCSSREDRAARRLPASPHDVTPPVCATPQPRRGNRGRAGRPFLGGWGQAPFFVFRVFVFARIGPHHRSRLMSEWSTCPSWACSSSWGDPQTLARLPPCRAVALGFPPVCCQIAELLRSTA